ncbi:Uncharacterised protein [uncultured archaeon]|nr:Uncharacterised protein [uncultured archaeon]
MLSEHIGIFLYLVIVGAAICGRIVLVYKARKS